MSPLRKPLFITNGCKIQYLRHQEKSFLNVAMATSAGHPSASRFNRLNVPQTFTPLTGDRSFTFFLDLEFFAHFHGEKGFRSGLIYGLYSIYKNA